MNIDEYMKEVEKYLSLIFTKRYRKLNNEEEKFIKNFEKRQKKWEKSEEC